MNPDENASNLIYVWLIVVAIKSLLLFSSVNREQKR